VNLIVKRDGHSEREFAPWGRSRSQMNHQIGEFSQQAIDAILADIRHEASLH
jgi:hypothetical protein